MRCYSCSGFGNKSQDRWNTWKQSMGSFSYNSTRKANKYEGTNDERKNSKKKVWMKSTDQLHIGETDQVRENDIHMASQS